SRLEFLLFLAHLILTHTLPQLCRICDFDHCVPQKIAATNLPIRETEKLVKEFYIELFHQL
ncbi:MAG: hypothetical protein ACLTYC_11610, partial [Ruminococcus callidus]|uniref:hypothetical protein n=1 Tax=Ruminococcus callidus TaxID=40519 RepID=UPI003992635A